MNDVALMLARPQLQVIADPVLADYGIRLRILRLDQIHPLVSGNKWYKLKLNLAAARAQGSTTVLSFGGAYSNHLYALAAAGKMLGLQTIGVVRGEDVPGRNPVLDFASAQGMHLHFISRAAYARKAECTFQDALRKQFGDVYIVPEGGANLAGVQGCAEIASALHWDEDSAKRYVTLACGTGTTLAGLLAGLSTPCRVLAYSVLKGEDRLSATVKAWLDECGTGASADWHINTAFHCGGYARTTPALQRFMSAFKARTEIELDYVYTGKMMYGLYQMLANGEFAAGSDIIAIHTGGLAGAPISW